MQKYLKPLLIGLCIPLLTGCFNSSAYDRYKGKIKKYLNIDITQGEEIINYETHGGFHNDGLTCYGIKYKDNNVLNQITNNKKWHETPFPIFVEAALYGYEYQDMYFGPFISNFDSNETLVPRIDHGYYCFLDRYGNIDVDQLGDYFCYNFTIGVYDLDTNSFYFCEMDT